MPRPYQLQRAFSLIELLIVLLVIGILTSVAVPNWIDSMMIQRVESAARRIQQDIELIRRDALAKSITRTFDFTNASTYILTGFKDLDHAGATYAVDLGAAPYHVTVKTVNFDGLDHFEFNGHGLPTRGGNIKIQAGDHWRQIDVDAATGEVTITNK